MEEDIKILEDLIKEKDFIDYEKYQVKIDTAIENLIKGYKELEEMLEHIEKFRELNLSSEIDYVIALKSNFMTYLKTDYIPKSKVREKMQELYDKARKEEGYIYNHIDEYYYATEILKELLKEEK